MKTTFCKIIPRAALVSALASITASALLAADPATPPDAPRRERPDRAAPDRAGAERRDFRMNPGGFPLDDKQRELLREATQKNSEQLRSLEEKLRAAQKELLQAAISEKYDEKVVREKADAVAKIQADIAVLRASALSSVAPTLKPEQREQLENSPVGAALLSGGGVGGFGGFRGGPPEGVRGRDGQPAQPGQPQPPDRQRWRNLQ